MFKLYRVDRDDRGKPKAVYIGQRYTINKARKFLAQQSDAGTAGVFFEYGSDEIARRRVPLPDPHAKTRRRSNLNWATTGRPGRDRAVSKAGVSHGGAS